MGSFQAFGKDLEDGLLEGRVGIDGGEEAGMRAEGVGQDLKGGGLKDVVAFGEAMDEDG